MSFNIGELNDITIDSRSFLHCYALNSVNIWDLTASRWRNIGDDIFNLCSFKFLLRNNNNSSLNWFNIRIFLWNINNIGNFILFSLFDMSNSNLLLFIWTSLSSNKSILNCFLSFSLFDTLHSLDINSQFGDSFDILENCVNIWINFNNFYNIGRSLWNSTILIGLQCSWSWFLLDYDSLIDQFELLSSFILCY